MAYTTQQQVMNEEKVPYETPSFEIVGVKLQDIICASPGLTDGGSGDGDSDNYGNLFS